MKYNGGVGPKQLRWLEEQLAEASRAGQRVVMFGHVPLHPQATDDKSLVWNFDEVRGIKKNAQYQPMYLYQPLFCITVFLSVIMFMSTVVSVSTSVCTSTIVVVSASILHKRCWVWRCVEGPVWNVELYGVFRYDCASQYLDS